MSIVCRLFFLAVMGTVVGISASGCGCNNGSAAKTASLTITGATMGTSYSVKVNRLPESFSLLTLQAEIDRRLETLNDQMSTYRADSEVSRFNRFTKTDWFPVSKETAIVVQKALQIGEQTGGAFDVTVAPLVDLWNFGPRKGPQRLPSDAEISAAKKRTGAANLSVRLDPPALKKQRGDLTIDLSAIAKGFAVDQIAAFLDRLSISGYMVEIGGEVYCRGKKSDGSSWKIGIQSPRKNLGKTSGAKNRFSQIVPVQNRAVATSGDYRNYFEQNGKRYSHTIDPRTGRPVTHRLISVTVVADSCMEADALATALMVLGPEAGYDFARRNRLAVLLLVSEHDTIQERITVQQRMTTEFQTVIQSEAK